MGFQDYWYKPPPQMWPKPEATFAVPVDRVGEAIQTLNMYGGKLVYGATAQPTVPFGPKNWASGGVPRYKDTLVLPRKPLMDRETLTEAALVVLAGLVTAAMHWQAIGEWVR